MRYRYPKLQTVNLVRFLGEIFNIFLEHAKLIIIFVNKAKSRISFCHTKNAKNSKILFLYQYIQKIYKLLF